MPECRCPSNVGETLCFSACQLNGNLFCMTRLLRSLCCSAKKNEKKTAQNQLVDSFIEVNNFVNTISANQQNDEICDQTKEIKQNNDAYFRAQK